VLTPALPENTWKHSSSDDVSATRRSCRATPAAAIVSAQQQHDDEEEDSIAIASSTANRRIRGTLIEGLPYLASTATSLLTRSSAREHEHGADVAHGEDDLRHLPPQLLPRAPRRVRQQ
jgi:hypothetical protein